MCSIAMPGELMLGHGSYARRPLYRATMATSMSHQRAASARSVPPPRMRACLSRPIVPAHRRDRGCNRVEEKEDDGEDEDEDEDADADADEGRRVSVAAAAAAAAAAATTSQATGDKAVARRKQKRVVFADDRGRPLTQVRIMSEPSNVPPTWTSAYLASLARGSRRAEGDETRLAGYAPSTGTKTPPPWETSFVQPASDYLAFRRKLDEEAVSLENVIVREVDECLVGTIKVKNLAYDKEVIVRTSTDGWLTSEDLHCSYVEQPVAARAATPPPLILYDTFRFRLTLPLNSDHIEFCVRYRVIGGSEYWDNNFGKNYVVRRKPWQQNRALSTNSTDTRFGGCATAHSESELLPAVGRESGIARITDATRANIVTWSEFASWQHLNNEAPYCSNWQGAAHRIEKRIARWLARAGSTRFLEFRRQKRIGRIFAR